MSFNFFNLLVFSQFFLGGVFLYSNKINSVEDIISGSVTIWGTVVIVLSMKSTWDKAETQPAQLKKIPQSESFRTQLSSGLTSFVLSIAILGGNIGGKFGYEHLFWFALLFVSTTQLVKVFNRTIFQIRANRRLDRYRQYLRFKTN